MKTEDFTLSTLCGLRDKERKTEVKGFDEDGRFHSRLSPRVQETRKGRERAHVKDGMY